MSIKHIGIILSVIGAVLLAISLRIKGGSGWSFSGISPTETHINKWLFYSGLGLMVAGSLMQW